VLLVGGRGAMDRELKNGRVVARVRVVRAYEQLAGLLRERITSGDLREGERLPSETALAEQAGVSRSTVREALRTLEQAGLIHRASPRVMVVARREEDPVFRDLRHELRRRNVTFHHLHEALVMLEPELTRLAALRADEADVRELWKFVEEQEQNLEHFQEWSRLDVEFHLAIAEMSGNPALIITREPITQLLLPVLHRFMDSASMTEHATRYHRRMVAEIEAGDPDTAAAVTRRHVNDFRIAWEKRGLDFHQEIASLTESESENLD
jgi:GntR family transcriptional regulator, transcriptional repressor for pyruvate dehydrogenase complex